MNGANPGGWVNEFQVVGGNSPSDVWAVGEILGDVTSLDRAVHWNGTRWRKAGVLPSVAEYAPLITSVHSFGSGNVWAFGCYCAASQSPYIARLRNGTWHDLTPKAPAYGGIWTASAISPTDIWAVAGGSSSTSFALLHWNGSAWSTVRVPQSLTLGPAAFSPGGGIVATATGGVWLAGYVGSNVPAVVHDVSGAWHVTKIAAPALMQSLVPDGSGGLWSSTAGIGNTSAEIWHFAGGHWSRAADPAGISGSYAITWMAHVPGGTTTLAIGGDQKNEVLLSSP